MSRRSDSIANKVYKYVHNDRVWVLTNIKGREFDSDWMSLDKDGRIEIKGDNGEGYAWDGCSPKFHFLDLIWGTPDGKVNYDTEKPMTYYGSMLHDVIYQFKGHEKMPISRKEADRLFFQILKQQSFLWRGVYLLGVRVGGAFYGNWRTRKSESGIRLLDASWQHVHPTTKAKPEVGEFVG